MARRLVLAGRIGPARLGDSTWPGVREVSIRAEQTKGQGVVYAMSMYHATAYGYAKPSTRALREAFAEIDRQLKNY